MPRAGTASLAPRDLPRSRGAALLVEGEPPRRLVLREDPVVVGRAAECDLVLDDPCVSERHFAIGWEDGALRLRDLGSHNGTRVNGLRVEASTIGPGVWIEVGRTRLRCVTSAVRSAAHILGRAPATRAVRGRIERFAPLAGPVLVRGESGTGKELVARALHEAGPRAHGPFVAVNCAGFAPELVDSELFGHERGAFTGATERRRGAFELADRGTLFLDELGELPAAQQAKLLRVLESRELRRVGGERIAHFDARVVAATNADLEGAIAAGRFRSDLFHRLAVLEIRLPPLRQRREDLPLLAEALLAELAPELGVRRLSAPAIERLGGHEWPGNVRELRNVLYRAAAAAAGERIGPEELDFVSVTAAPRAWTDLDPATRARTACEVLTAHHGNVSAAARTIGIARSTLRAWLRVLPQGPLPG